MQDRREQPTVLVQVMLAILPTLISAFLAAVGAYFAVSSKVLVLEVKLDAVIADNKALHAKEVQQDSYISDIHDMMLLHTAQPCTPSDSKKGSK